MKVVIVSTPRTCSSLMSEIFVNRYNLKNKSEIISSCTTETDVQQVLQSFVDEDDFVVKITSTSLRTFPDILNHNTFSWNIFDKIVLTERANIDHQYASWLLLNHAQRNGKYSNEEVYTYLNELFQNDFHDFDISIDEVKHIKRDVSYYHDTLKPHLLGLNLPTYVVTHELFQHNVEEYIITLNSLLDESFAPQNINSAMKGSVDYTKFVEHTNLTNIINTTSAE